MMPSSDIDCNVTRLEFIKQLKVARDKTRAQEADEVVELPLYFANHVPYVDTTYYVFL